MRTWSYTTKDFKRNWNMVDILVSSTHSWYAIGFIEAIG